MSNKIKLREALRTHFPLISGPVWNDACRHEKESYVCSYHVIRSENQHYREDKYDLYLFDSSGDQEVCIRYGSEGSQYISPGRLGDFMSSVSWHCAEYKAAQRILKELGTLSWEPHKS